MKTTDRDAKTFPRTPLDARSGGENGLEAGEHRASPPFRRPIACFVIVLTASLAGGAPAYADEQRAPLAERDAVPVTDVADLDYRRGLAVDAASIGDTEGVLFSGYTVPPSRCLCTNLNHVSVICEDCDGATDANLCHTHDRACQDAAQAGGVREHSTFFCTSPD